MAQQELEKRDLSELTAICEDLPKQYASVDPGCSAPRKSAARQQQRFSTITCALFTHFDTSLDLDVIRSLVLKQLVTIRVHLEFAALHDTDFRGTSEVLNSLKDIQGRKWIQKLEGIPSEVLDAVKCTMDRLDELGKAIRQDPDPEVPTDTPAQMRFTNMGNDSDQNRNPSVPAGMNSSLIKYDWSGFDSIHKEMMHLNFVKYKKVN
ncbi:hypothetical protein NOF04DRAFT_6325 [Fusarium oxysporum II5]|uniref:Uncharacterized protein n=1 Tax=Fusarium odoratissimum (strain NRRL 54006) TaxID=1089451 RepID=X0JC30_FUSO5|nr:uncharacterized protein FOIG_09497 [Fusarium odoratissimum NRRL 54006]EXL98773.1 hypothetical protein FOIG_09497 [Fusarium odoratissimum NRRL 54006]KAK2129195.1 hypothetical protein NOF04DRAFT_6325 [Fusarium oxysporum II5]